MIRSHHSGGFCFFQITISGVNVMSKEEIIKAIQACAKELGRNPTQRELEIMTGITDKILWRRFGSLSKALEASGLEARGRGFPAEEAALLLDWGAVVRMLGKMPSVNEYRRGGRFSDTPFLNRYGRWSDVGRAFRKFVRSEEHTSELQSHSFISYAVF